MSEPECRFGVQIPPSGRSASRAESVVRPVGRGMFAAFLAPRTESMEAV